MMTRTWTASSTRQAFAETGDRQAREKNERKPRRVATRLGYDLESLHRARAEAITMIAPACQAWRSWLEPLVKYSTEHTTMATPQITRHWAVFGYHIGYSVFHKTESIEKDTPAGQLATALMSNL